MKQIHWKRQGQLCMIRCWRGQTAKVARTGGNPSWAEWRSGRRKQWWIPWISGSRRITIWGRGVEAWRGVSRWAAGQKPPQQMSWRLFFNGAGLPRFHAISILYFKIQACFCFSARSTRKSSRSCNTWCKSRCEVFNDDFSCCILIVLYISVMVTLLVVYTTVKYKREDSQTMQTWVAWCRFFASCEPAGGCKGGRLRGGGCERSRNRPEINGCARGHAGGSTRRQLEDDGEVQRVSNIVWYYKGLWICKAVPHVSWKINSKRHPAELVQILGNLSFESAFLSAFIVCACLIISDNFCMSFHSLSYTVFQR